MDENQLTDEAFLTPPAPKPPQESVKTLALAAIAAVDQSATNSSSLTEIEIELCKKLMKALYRGTKFTSITARHHIFVYACHVRRIPVAERTRAEMYTALINSVCSVAAAINFVSFPYKIDTEKRAVLGEDPINRGPVLGKDVMHAIWADMRKTILPSWVGAAPKNWGTKKRGKLSADHWRTIFTIHLPITLIWLWRDETGRKKELLFNMIDLVMAIQSANYKNTNVNISEVYDECIDRYMAGVAELFKEDNVTPSQHSAFHIGENLRDFGPQHPRSAQFYERYIHLLQRQNTNMKFGELKITLRNNLH